MSFFVWREEFETGINEVDRQHRRLVELIDELYTAMSQGRGKDVLGKVLSELIKYTKTHFAYEEYLMNIHQYPELMAHKMEHKRLTDRVIDFERNFEQGNTGITVNLMDFLKGWLSNHILKTDQRYAPFLRSKGVR